MLMFFIGMGLYLASDAQSETDKNRSQVYQTISYDTLISGQGYGNYSVHFPQWNSRLGKLAAVKIQTVTLVQYGFQLGNVGNESDSFKVTVGRTDTIATRVSSLRLGSYSTHSIGSFFLDSAAVQSREPFTLITNDNHTDSITENLESFIGQNSIAFSFLPVTWSVVESNNHSAYHYSAVMRDTTVFSITYIYITPDTASLVQFSALRKSPENIDLAWTIAHEAYGRQYEIQLSSDSVHYNGANTPLLSQPANDITDYHNTYSTETEKRDVYFFRLKVTDPSRVISYSPVRKVITNETIDSGLSIPGKMEIFPNPATDFIRLTFAGIPAGDWQVNIISTDGRLVQRSIFSNTNTALINLGGGLPSGAYFVMATENGTARHYTGKFLIR
jgi:Secretion system C-terminal sorting domain